MPPRRRLTHVPSEPSPNKTRMLKVTQRQHHVPHSRQVRIQRQATNHTRRKASKWVLPAKRNQHVTTTKQLIQLLRQTPM